MKRVCKWIAIGLGVLLGLVYLISIPLVRNYISDALFICVQNEKAYEQLMKLDGIEQVELETSIGTCRLLWGFAEAGYTKGKIHMRQPLFIFMVRPSVQKK